MLRHLNAHASPPPRVVILGAGGFVSPHLQSALGAAGIAVRAIGSSEINLQKPEAAVRLAAVITRGDTVVMAAALTPEKGRTYRNLMGNLQMAAVVCEALESSPCRHFIYFSSDAVYDARTTPIDEGSSREAADFYALAHASREMMLRSVLESSKIPFCCLRPTGLYGPGDTHDAYGPNRFIRTALTEGRIVLFGGGEELRSHVFIRDAIELVHRTIVRQSVGILNLASAPALSFRCVAETVARHCRHSVQIDFQPRTVPPFDRPFSVAAMLEAFPDFVPTSLDSGIAASIRAATDGSKLSPPS